MKKLATVVIITSGLLGLMAIGGCTQMPTEKQSISDIRPQISFRAADERTHDARVLLNGLDMGAVRDYLEGASSLRILPGSHVLRIASGGAVIHEEKFYIADGTNRTFILK
jgi:hypothetical protein